MIESINKLPRWLSWGLGFTIIIINGWLLLPVFRSLQPLFTVVVAAALLAFLLEYPVLFLISRGLKRSYAVAGVFGLALVILLTLGITLLPLLLAQLDQLAHRLPSWIESGTNQLQTLQVWAGDRHLPVNVSAIIAQLEDRLANELQVLPTQILDFAIEAFDSTLEVLLVIVLTFYLLLDGERLWAGIFQWLPASLGSQIQTSLQQSFRNYYLGQATIAAMMGVTVTIAFLVLRVPFGLLFGIGIGALVLIPLGDIFGIISVSLLMTLKSVWLGVEVLVVATLIDQAIDQAIAPRIMGKFVGLNPVWIIISLLLGVKAGGVLGVIIAVPLAGALKNLTDNLRNTNEGAKLNEITERLSG